MHSENISNARLTEAFNQLMLRHWALFREACLEDELQDGLGGSLVAIDEALFGGLFKRELMFEETAYDDFYQFENEWFNTKRA